MCLPFSLTSWYTNVLFLSELAHGIAARFVERDKKLQNMDEKAMNDLALELVGDDGAEDAKKKEEADKVAKKKAAIQRRLEVEARKEAKKSKSKSKKSDDDDDDVALNTFAKGSRIGKKKN